MRIRRVRRWFLDVQGRKYGSERTVEIFGSKQRYTYTQSTMLNDSIAFIGGGNMATSLVGGLIVDGVAPESLWVADPAPARRSDLVSRFNVHTTPDNIEAVANGNTVVLAVKPQVMASVVAELASIIPRRESLLISIAAGIRQSYILGWLGTDVPIVRAMPNTPALVGTGASALFANPFVSNEQRSQAESILRAVGLTLWVDDEHLLDTVTAVSGSGPAYFFLLMEVMAKAGEELGLSAEAARLLTQQTALGAAKMALESSDDPSTLRARVTSPGGTTERAIACLTDGGIEELVVEAVKAAHRRSVELGKMLGET